jgi:hypothetical protein
MANVMNLIDEIKCSVDGAYNFNSNKEETVGYIEKMSFTVSGTALKADTPVSDPEQPKSKLQVVAVLESVNWGGGPTDPIEVEARVSPENRALLLGCLASVAGGSDISASWVIKEYDHKAKAYFKRFHTDGKEIKLVLTQNEKVFVNGKPDPMIKQPVNFYFKMSLTPKSEGGEQTLCWAASAENKYTQQVGISVGG